ncbi:hemin uptake protein HemP [Thermomonas sp.]|uniref:hemin uptake protein HemP n=1 Tax=Thermomonas sp. TaxID=1971895 RepID=UPI0026294BEA|nr:hemin uptake protein HemP [Thermomonas sp.]MCO5055646.1 hemin uptake protein HemP [Thermomonas sp.]HRO63159.1 hemin uptake protein HemP [Thermomonas sp.]
MSDPPAKSVPTPSGPPLRCLESGQLLRGQCEVLIRHGDEIYRLRHTRNGKLILTK